jgi:NitT/TauT family transport system substrate-binding protein
MTGALGLRAVPGAAEAPPETTRLRIPNTGAICLAPQYAADDLLQAEGFTQVEYVKLQGLPALEQAMASGEVDLSMSYALRWVVRLDAGHPITVIAGVHTGCNELFGSDRIRSVRDLKGKKIAVAGLGGVQHQLVSIVLTQVGIDSQRDVEWVQRPAPEAIQLLAEGKVDGFMAFPPEPQELRARKIGHVLLDNGRDRPWSQYFCCMIAANRDFLRRNPIACKRAVRAILKAADLCSQAPDRVARHIVDRGFTANYDYARATMREVGYRAWREFDPEEALRFYALRLQEAGFIKSSPKRIIAEGTDWRALRELRKELKG